MGACTVLVFINKWKRVTRGMLTAMLRSCLGKPPAGCCYLQGALTAAETTDQQLDNGLKYKFFIM